MFDLKSRSMTGFADRILKKLSIIRSKVLPMIFDLLERESYRKIKNELLFILLFPLENLLKTLSKRMEGCQYRYSNGKKKGTLCGEETVGDEIFCERCGKYKTEDMLVLTFTDPECMGKFDVLKTMGHIVVEKDPGIPREIVHIFPEHAGGIIANLLDGHDSVYPYSEPCEGVNRVAFEIHKEILLRSWYSCPNMLTARMSRDLYIPLVGLMNDGSHPVERISLEEIRGDPSGIRSEGDLSLSLLPEELRLTLAFAESPHPHHSEWDPIIDLLREKFADYILP